MITALNFTTLRPLQFAAKASRKEKGHSSDRLVSEAFREVTVPELQQIVEALKFPEIDDDQTLGSQISTRAKELVTWLKNAQRGGRDSRLAELSEALKDQNLRLPPLADVTPILTGPIQSRGPSRVAKKGPSRPGQGHLYNTLNFLQFEFPGLRVVGAKDAGTMLVKNQEIKAGTLNSTLSPQLSAISKTEAFMLVTLRALQKLWKEANGDILKTPVALNSWGLAKQLEKKYPKLYKKDAYAKLLLVLTSLGVLTKRPPLTKEEIKARRAIEKTEKDHFKKNSLLIMQNPMQGILPHLRRVKKPSDLTPLLDEKVRLLARQHCPDGLPNPKSKTEHPQMRIIFADPSLKFVPPREIGASLRRQQQGS